MTSVMAQVVRERKTEARIRGMETADLVEEIHRLEDAGERLYEKLDAARTALETLFPASEGFTEAMDDLIDMGLLVEVPADDAYREEWDADTMYVWAWSELAGGPP